MLESSVIIIVILSRDIFFKSGESYIKALASHRVGTLDNLFEERNFLVI